MTATLAVILAMETVFLVIILLITENLILTVSDALQYMDIMILD